MCKFCEKQESIASCDKDVDAIIDDEGYFNVLQMSEASGLTGLPKRGIKTKPSRRWYSR